MRCADEARYEPAENLRLEQKGVMPVGRGDVAEAHVLPVRHEGIDDGLGLSWCKQPVARKADNEEPAPDICKRLPQRPVILAQIEIVGGLGYVKVAVGVESLHEAAPLVVEVCLDGEFGVEFVAVLFGASELSYEPFPHALLGEVGYVADHSSDCKPSVGAGAAVVLSVGEIGIAQNGASPHSVKGNRLGAKMGGRGDWNCRFDKIRVFDCPLQHLHPADRAADDGEKLLDSELVEQQVLG